MKILALYMLLFGLGKVSAQENVFEDSTIKPAITAAGKPDGEITEIKIGKAGGSFTSSDGKLRLIFPQGALTSNTNISIQPVFNLAPNGNGKAYQLKPAGIHFKQPVQIIFSYSESETEGSTTELLGIAMQDEKGRWSSLNKSVIDTTSKTLKAEIRHFSAYVNYSKAKITPSSARVKVDGNLRLKITMVADYNSDPRSESDDELSPLGVEIINSPEWTVNGIPGGDPEYGTISVSRNHSAIYKAPAQIPSRNPVAVSVEFKSSYTNINEQLFKNLKLVSNITIYDDAYEIIMEAAIQGGSPDAWGGIINYKDEGSFILSLEKNKPSVINIKNKLEVMTDNCTKIILNPTSCTGLIHVAGTKQIKVTPANPPGQPYPIVEIWFREYPIELTRYTFTCPPPRGYSSGQSKGNVDLMSVPVLSFFGMPAFPQYLKFIAKDEEQIILESPGDAREIFYKFRVRKIKENE